jgi:hypothetical protein
MAEWSSRREISKVSQTGEANHSLACSGYPGFNKRRYRKMNEKLISDIKLYGKTAKGKNDLINHLEGKRINMKQAVNAHCFDCMGFYADGKQDCNLTKCPLHPFMEYNEHKSKRISRNGSVVVQK